MSITTQKILILSCGTGGGHNSVAKAIQENLIERGINVDFIEYLDIINPRIRNKVNNLYIKSTRRNGKIFKVVYKLGEIYEKTNIKSPVYALNFLNKNRLYKYIVENKYKYIITTHLFAAQTLTAIKKEHNIKFMAVATDYVCIPFWKETNPDYFIIPSEDLIDDFVSKGIEKEKLLPLGIPTAKTYRQEYDKNECKKKLGLEVSKKYILILTGSMEFGNITDMMEELLKNIKDVSFIISTGNNSKMLEVLNEKYKNSDNLIILPFTNEISEYMEGNIVHIYPEAALWPYYEKIRKFKNGAFDLAVRNNVPIIPIVCTFREPNGIRKILKNKKDVTLKILEPINPQTEKKNRKEESEELKEKVFLEMKRRT